MVQAVQNLFSLHYFSFRLLVQYSMTPVAKFIFWAVLILVHLPTDLLSRIVRTQIETDTLWQESFEAGMPLDWWSVSPSNQVNWLVGETPSDSSNSWLFLENTGEPFENLVILTTDSLLLSPLPTAAQLQLDLSCTFSNGLGTFSIEAWDGEAWKSIFSHAESASGRLTRDISDLINPAFQLRFTYAGTAHSSALIGIDHLLISLPENVCDNGICEPGEDPTNCPFDCEPLSAPGNLWVPIGENLAGESVSYRAFKGRTACDDCSEQIDLPFAVSFYGKSYETVYLNANGNLTFEAPFYEFTPSNFCLNGPRMIAPFFADVDLDRCGSIDYYVDAHSLIVTWSEVCHFRGTDTPTGLTNTFQLILTDGSPTHIREIALAQQAYLFFNYGDMQWTAGNASGGLNGLSGISATVGLNSGNGIECFQYGRFAHAGYDFNPAAYADSTANGVDHLDYRSLNLLQSDAVPKAPEIDEALQVQVFPNPFSTRLNVLIEQAPTDQPVLLQLIDASGKVLLKKEILPTSDMHRIEIPTADFPMGIYFLTLQNGTELISKELVKLAN